MTNLREGLILTTSVVSATLLLMFLLLPAPSPWDTLLPVIAFVVAWTACFYGGNGDGLHRIRLPRVYYILSAVAVGAIALTLLLSYLIVEARGWLGLLVLVEFFFSLPLMLYVIVMFRMHE